MTRLHALHKNSPWRNASKGLPKQRPRGRRCLQPGNYLSNSTWQRVAVYGIAVLVVAISSVLFYYWRWGYNSNSVLSGLMAKSVLDRGERPIYVWSVGYQGILLNVYANALMFKIFGVGPRLLNLYTTLAYWGLLGLLFTYVRGCLGVWVAAGSVLFLLLGNPILTSVLVRNGPNYTETFSFGLLLFLLQRQLVQDLYVERRAMTRRHYGLFAAIGFLSGFGVYTYGQIYFFILSIALHIGLFYLRDAITAWRARTWHGRVILGLVALCLAYTATGVWAFCHDAPMTLQVGPLFTQTALGTIKRGVTALVGVAALDLCWRRFALVRRFAPAGLLTAACALIGYIPALWHVYVRHNPSVDKATTSGTLKDWLWRYDVAFQGNLWQLNITDVADLQKAVVNAPVLVITVVALSSFSAFMTWQISQFLRGKATSSVFLQMGPLALLPFVNLAIFGVSGAVVDLMSARYTLVLWFFWAIGFAWFFMQLIQKRQAWLTAAALVCAGILLINNATLLAKNVIQAEAQGFDGEEALAVLRERGITRGYGNYWSTYTINFFTNEDIILQPLFSAYCPHYGPLVAAAERLAVVDHNNTMRYPGPAHRVDIYGRPYSTRDHWEGQRNAVLILDAINRDL